MDGTNDAILIAKFAENSLAVSFAVNTAKMGIQEAYYLLFGKKNASEINCIDLLLLDPIAYYLKDKFGVLPYFQGILRFLLITRRKMKNNPQGKPNSIFIVVLALIYHYV